MVQAAKDLGTCPDFAAPMLRRERSGYFGVLFALGQPDDVAIVEAIYPAAERLGYDLVLGATGGTRAEHKAVAALLDHRVEALILVGPYLGRRQLTDLAQQIPVVQIGRRVDLPGVDSVRSLEDEGAELAVEHLIELGHRDIVHVDGGDLPGAKERRRGYRTAMRRHGLSDDLRIVPGDYTEASGAYAGRGMVNGGLPTAVFAGNDRCAHGIFTTFLRAGLRIPDDVSIIGYGDSPIGRMSFIDLTTVRQDAARMGELAVQATAERLDRTRIAEQRAVLHPSLIIRGSTAPPPQ